MRKVENNRPDAGVDYQEKKCTIVDLFEPCNNMRLKEDKKSAKYSSLALQVRKLHGVSTVVVLIAVCCLGVVSDQLEKNLKE